MNTPDQKEQKLRQLLQQIGSAIVAFSGGVDSAFLFKVAVEELGQNALGVTGRSASLPGHELEDVRTFVSRYQLPHQFIDTQELDDTNYLHNSSDRCFFCKDELFRQLKKLCKEKNIEWILDGANTDDLADHRPGHRAAERHGVRSPLQEAGLTKEDIRQLSEKMNLPTWNKPSGACLASRFPYGVEITPSELLRVDRCEMHLRNLGIRQVRVRHHRETARIEVDPCDFEKIFEHRELITRHFRQEGYRYITLDLEGFRSGSLNLLLDESQKMQNAPEKTRKEKPFIPRTFGHGVHTLYTDGGCRNNPGPGAWAFVLFDHEGREAARGSGRMEHTTSNLAEYQALLEGLTESRRRQVDKITVLSDSELLVFQMNGTYRIKHPALKEKALSVLEIRRQFEQFDILHVPRSENQLADRLAGDVLKQDRNRRSSENNRSDDKSR